MYLFITRKIAVLLVTIAISATAASQDVEVRSEFDKSMETQLTVSIPSDFELLSSPSIQKELELIENQRQRLGEMQKEYLEKVRGMMAQLRSRELSGEDYTTMLLELKEDNRTQLDELILPHQFNRLEQIKVQTHLGRAGFGRGAADDFVADILGLSEKQKKELANLSKKFADELREKVAEVKQREKDAILSLLTPRQRKKMTDLIGDKFVSNKKDFDEAKKRK